MATNRNKHNKSGGEKYELVNELEKACANSWHYPYSYRTYHIFREGCYGSPHTTNYWDRVVHYRNCLVSSKQTTGQIKTCSKLNQISAYDLALRPSSRHAPIGVGQRDWLTINFPSDWFKGSRESRRQARKA